MKLMRLAAVAAGMMAAMALAACSTSSGGGSGYAPGGGTGGSIEAPGYPQQQELRDEQAMIAVESLYNVAATAYVAASEQGQIPAEIQNRAQDALALSYESLKLARAAHRIGDATTFRAQAIEAGRLATLARDLIPK